MFKTKKEQAPEKLNKEKLHKFSKKAKSSKNDKSNFEGLKKNIIVRIISDKEGLKVLTDVIAIRLKSDKYHLLIMADYVPTLGEINGDITFITNKEEIKFANIKGFYKLQHNEFTLLIDKQGESSTAEEKK